MKLDLIRPCANCPFRSDVRPYLRKGRAREIARALLGDQSFSCHQTNSYDDESGEIAETSESQHCAGALIMLERLEHPNQMMRWMERVNQYDRRKLDMQAPVFSSFKAFVNAQEPPRVTAIIERID
jgi:hypothetical protein